MIMISACFCSSKSFVQVIYESSESTLVLIMADVIFSSQVVYMNVYMILTTSSSKHKFILYCENFWTIQKKLKN